MIQAVRAADRPTFRAAAQLEAVHWLIQALGSMQPFAAVTGEPGVGKSAVAAEAATQLEARGYLVIPATPPFAGPLELQALLAAGLGLTAGLKVAPAAIAATLQGRVATAEPAKPAVLLIDGAETLPPAILQYLWLMHRLCWIGRPALQMVFIGRAAFWDQVAAPGLSELQNAVAARSVVQPLSGIEALAYLQYRMILAGAAEPVSIPQRLAPEILALGQGVPSRINLIADSIVAHDPNRLRVTQPGVRAAAAMLAGGSALVRTPPGHRRGGTPALIAGAAGAAVLAAGWLLLTRPDPWTPDRVTPAIGQKLATAAAARPLVPVAAANSAQVVKPRSPSPPAPRPPPAKVSAPVTAPVSMPVAAPASMPPPPASAATSTSAPAPVAKPAAVPTPPPTSASAPTAAAVPTPTVPVAVAKAVAVAPPIVVLPDAAMPRISVQYSDADPGVAVHARAVVAMLRARGLPVGDPAPVATATRSTAVEYYFVEDRDEATQLARELGGTVSVGHIDGRNPDLPPPPGTLRVVLSGHLASAAVSIPEPASPATSVPAGAGRPSAD